MNACEKSIGSMEMSEVVEDELLIDRVLLDKDSFEYLPHHNVGEVLGAYSRANSLSSEDGVRRMFEFRKSK